MAVSQHYRRVISYWCMYMAPPVWQQNYCYRLHPEQGKKCFLQNLFLIHHREFWPSGRWPSTVTISLVAFPFEAELHYLASTAEPAHPSSEIPEAKLVFPLLQCSYQCIRPPWDYTHPVNRKDSLRGCHNRLCMPALHNFATAARKPYAPLKPERRLFLHYAQSCRPVTTKHVQIPQSNTLRFLQKQTSLFYSYRLCLHFFAEGWAAVVSLCSPGKH